MRPVMRTPIPRSDLMYQPTAPSPPPRKASDTRHRILLRRSVPFLTLTGINEAATSTPALDAACLGRGNWDGEASILGGLTWSSCKCEDVGKSNYIWVVVFRKDRRGWWSVGLMGMHLGTLRENVSASADVRRKWVSPSRLLGLGVNNNLRPERTIWAGSQGHDGKRLGLGIARFSGALYPFAHEVKYT